MKELEYPFNGREIIENKKRLRRRLLEREGVTYTDKKIAVLGGYTTGDIVQVLELFLLDAGIRPVFYESAYNQYYQEAMFPNPALEVFSPDLIYICTSNRNIDTYPSLDDPADDIDALLTAQTEKFTAMWDHLAEVYHCPVIQNNFERPYWRLMGNRDATDPHGRVSFINRLNAGYAASHENFYLLDLDYLSGDYGLREWSDPFYWHMYKYAVAVPAIPVLSYQTARIIRSIYGKNKKGLVLDLDNTLWGGVIGDDGPENIVLGPEEPEGQIYSEFQSYLAQLKKLGILLNIDSKNDEANALAGLKHPDSGLSEEDFICIRANWEPKDRNFREIADELNLLPESLVFVDDNPAERHIVREQIPGVSAPDFDRPCDMIGVIDRSGFFEVTTLSEDDRRRNDMYRENAGRQRLRASFTDYREYLVSLQMRAEITPFEPLYMARIAQLTNKSNQFNLTTRRYTQSEIEEIAADDRYITLCGRLADRFGDNGVVSLAIGRIEGDVCHIELWLMSCRVLKRNMEYAMMDELVHRLGERGVGRILGYYLPTAKNGMVRDFFADMGYTLIASEDSGNTTWELDIRGGYTDKNDVIRTEEA